MRISFPALALAVLSVCANTVSAQSGPRIAVLVDGPSDTFRASTEALATEVNALIGSRHEGWSFPAAPTQVGDFSEERANQLLAEALADRTIDIVVAFGIRMGQAVGATETLSKPVFLPYAAPRVQNLPRDGERSGRANLSYLTGLIDLPRELTRFRDVIRRPSVAVVVDQHYFDSVEGLAEVIQAAAGETMEATVVPAADTAQAILDAIPESAESVYLGPLVKLPFDQIPTLIEGLNRRHLPTYASEGRGWVEIGAFVSVVPRDDTQRRMRRVALNMESALDGDNPETFGTGFASRAELVINMRTANRIGIWPRFELMTEAELIGEEPGNRGEVITIREAVEQALGENVDLAQARHDVRSADAQLDEGIGALLPTLDGTANFTWLDPDVARNGNAERTLSWGLTATQVVYSPLAWGAHDSLQDNVRAVGHALTAAELDTTLQTVESYLNVLRALTAEEINRENLRRVRQNLALAEVRVEVGAAGRQEVFRWQAELADGRVAVISSNARRNQAEIALNRVLNRQQERPIQTSDPMDPETGLMLVDPRIREYVQDQWSFRVLRAFMVQEALERSPELKQLDAGISAQENLLGARELQLFVPDVFVSGGFTHTFHRSGAGSGPIVIGTASIEPDEFTWQFGAGLRFNFFDMSRYAQIDQNEIALGRLATQREQVAQGIEQRVRSAMHQVGASAAAVGLRAEAAEAARQNLTLVIDAYRLGSVSLITLVDAQTSALQSELGAANAQYDFLVDFANVERASARFGFLADQPNRDDFVNRLEAFADRRRARANQRRDERELEREHDPAQPENN